MPQSKVRLSVQMNAGAGRGRVSAVILCTPTFQDVAKQCGNKLKLSKKKLKNIRIFISSGSQLGPSSIDPPHWRRFPY